MNPPNPQISLIIPIFNEAGNLPRLFDALTAMMAVQAIDFEIILINDGSTDNSMQEIEQIIARDKRFCYIDFSRNFGKEMATTAGLREARGNGIIMLDADLQHPIELIPEFITKWQEGYEVVVGLRTGNSEENVIKRWGSWLFYTIINSIGETRIVRNATDFRLLDRTVVDAYNQLPEHNRITRGLIDWMGFRRTYIPFVAEPRQTGQASYNLFKLLRLALSSFVSHSLFPLKFAGYLGLGIMAVSGPLGVFVFINKYVLADPLGYAFTGPAALAVIMMFLIGVVLVCLGLMALYIANISIEVSGRPLYIIRNKSPK